MNKKPIHTDFLNLQWKPAPMFYGFKPNVRPYILPHNRGKLPMPKAGHIQFGEVAALDKAEFNPLPNKPELQLPGKIFYTEPIPEQKFLNAATVRKINSGKIRKVFTGVKLVSTIGDTIVDALKNNNLKLITLEMVKNSITGLKIDTKLGTIQQQLLAKSSYDNLLVQYSGLVDKKLDTPENTQKIIDQYEKEMVAIYGPDIRKNAPEVAIDELTTSINRLVAASSVLYDMIKNKSINEPQLEQEQEEQEQEEQEQEGGPRLRASPSIDALGEEVEDLRAETERLFSQPPRTENRPIATPKEVERLAAEAERQAEEGEGVKLAARARAIRLEAERLEAEAKQRAQIPTSEELERRFLIFTGEKPADEITDTKDLEKRLSKLMAKYNTNEEIIASYSDKKNRVPLPLSSIFLTSKNPERSIDLLFSYILNNYEWGTYVQGQKHLITKMYNRLVTESNRLLKTKIPRIISTADKGLTKDQREAFIGQIKKLTLDIIDKLRNKEIYKEKTKIKEADPLQEEPLQEKPYGAAEPFVEEKGSKKEAKQQLPKEEDVLGNLANNFKEQLKLQLADKKYNIVENIILEGGDVAGALVNSNMTFDLLEQLGGDEESTKVISKFIKRISKETNGSIMDVSKSIKDMGISKRNLQLQLIRISLGSYIQQMTPFVIKKFAKEEKQDVSIANFVNFVNSITEKIYQAEGIPQSQYDIIKESLTYDDPEAALLLIIDQIKDLGNLDVRKRRAVYNIVNTLHGYDKTFIKIEKLSSDLLSGFEINDTLKKCENFAIQLIRGSKVKQQAAPGRKRKSRKRPAKKSVKKLSANVNNQILRLLKS